MKRPRRQRQPKPRPLRMLIACWFSDQAPDEQAIYKVLAPVVKSAGGSQLAVAVERTSGDVADALIDEGEGLPDLLRRTPGPADAD